MTYLAGHLEVTQPDGTKAKQKVVVFSNQNKQKDNQPDYPGCIFRILPLERRRSADPQAQQDSNTPEAEDLL